MDVVPTATEESTPFLNTPARMNHANSQNMVAMQMQVDSLKMEL